MTITNGPDSECKQKRRLEKVSQYLGSIVKPTPKVGPPVFRGPTGIIPRGTKCDRCGHMLFDWELDEGWKCKNCGKHYGGQVTFPEGSMSSLQGLPEGQQNDAGEHSQVHVQDLLDSVDQGVET